MDLRIRDFPKKLNSELKIMAIKKDMTLNNYVIYLLEKILEMEETK